MGSFSKWVSVLAIGLWAGCGDDGGPGGAGGGGGTGGDGGTGGSVMADIEIAGLSAPVSAHFDTNGVLNAECETDEDCAATLGYFHARDRFVQMDLRRRFTTGRLTAFLTAAARAFGATETDIENRALYSTLDGEPAEDAVIAAATPKTLALYEAYANGVNAWIADLKAGRNGAVFPREFQNGLLFDYELADIPDWTPKDSISTVLALIESLTNNSAFEIDLAARRAALIDGFGAVQGENMFRDLFDTRPDVDSAVLPDFGMMASVYEPLCLPKAANSACSPSANPLIAPSVAGRIARRQVWKELLGHPGSAGGYGSNNWVVGPTKSQSGNALLSNDPHLGMTNPATWYMAHLDAKTNGSGDIHAAGVTFAGVPVVIIGQNEDIAWGATTTNFDMTDVYVETLNAAGDAVMFNGAEVPIITKMVTFNFPDGGSETAELQFVPHHGPILPKADDADPTLSLRWTGTDTDTDVNFLTKLAMATDIAEARTALEDVTTIGQNWVVIDDQGGFGWFPYNRLPKRPWATGLDGDAVPWLPLDGTGDYEWESYYALNELPQALNPTEGFIATANNDMTGALFDSDPTNESFGVLQTDVAPGWRHQRIVDLLGANDAHTTDSMLEIVADTHSLIGETLTPPILTAAMGLSLTDNALKVVNALGSWGYTCPSGVDGIDAEADPLVSDATELAESAGCAAFHVAIREINQAALADEGIRGERGPNITLVKMLLGQTLNAGEIYWDDVSTDGPTETKDQIIADALDSAGTFLVTELGDDETQWAWGRIHSLTMRSDIDSASGGIVTEFNESGFANNGGLFTVDVANPNADYTQTAGPSMRMVCEGLPAGPACTIQFPGGQSGHPENDNYIDLLEDFLNNVPRPIEMDIAAAASGAATTLVLAAP